MKFAVGKIDDTKNVRRKGKISIDSEVGTPRVEIKERKGVE